VATSHAYFNFGSFEKLLPVKYVIFEIMLIVFIV